MHTEARLTTFAWIETWYKTHRQHSSLVQISPINFEWQNLKNKENAKMQNWVVPVNNSVTLQAELYIDCDRNVTFDWKCTSGQEPLNRPMNQGESNVSYQHQ